MQIDVAKCLEEDLRKLTKGETISDAGSPPTLVKYFSNSLMRAPPRSYT